MSGKGMALGAAMMGALTAGEADAQASEIMIRLETGEQIVMEVSHVQRETQEAVMDHLRDCIAAGEQIQDVCVAGAAALMAEEQLEGVVRETWLKLAPLEQDIGLTPAELIEEPAFCYVAEAEGDQQACTDKVATVQLASLDLQIAEARARRIAAEARAQAEAARADDELLRGERLDQEQDTLAAERDAALSSAEEAKIRADAAEAVLVVLRQIAAEEAAAQSSGPSLTN